MTTEIEDAGGARLDEPDQGGGDRGDAARRRDAGFRYGGVLVLALAVVMVLVGLPSGDWSRALALALEMAALIVVVLTSREREAVRRRRALVIGGAAAAVVTTIGAGAMPAVVTYGIAVLLAVSIPASLFGGLVRLVRSRGVTIQVVAGALAIYLLVGLMFAFAVSLAAHVDSGPYFAHGGNGSLSERVYFSFTVLTTTGFGDFTARQSFGRALAVLEMLMGQLYLVTVIGVLVGDIASRRRGPP